MLPVVSPGNFGTGYRYLTPSKRGGYKKSVPGREVPEPGMVAADGDRMGQASNLDKPCRVQPRFRLSCRVPEASAAEWDAGTGNWPFPRDAFCGDVLTDSCFPKQRVTCPIRLRAGFSAPRLRLQRQPVNSQLDVKVLPFLFSPEDDRRSLFVARGSDRIKILGFKNGSKPPPRCIALFSKDPRSGIDQYRVSRRVGSPLAEQFQDLACRGQSLFHVSSFIELRNGELSKILDGFGGHPLWILSYTRSEKNHACGSKTSMKEISSVSVHGTHP